MSVSLAKSPWRPLVSRLYKCLARQVNHQLVTCQTTAYMPHAVCGQQICQWMSVHHLTTVSVTLLSHLAWLSLLRQDYVPSPVRQMTAVPLQTPGNDSEKLLSYSVKIEVDVVLIVIRFANCSFLLSCFFVFCTMMFAISMLQ